MPFVNLKYYINENRFDVETNARDPKGLILEYVRSQMGKGTDNSKATSKDVYEIKITLDTTDDTFGCVHDCGNLGLRDGILLEYACNTIFSEED